MLVQSFLNGAWVEIAALKSSRLKEQSRQLLPKLFPHPVHKRQREALLGTINHITWHAQTLGQALQNILLVSVAKFPLRRQTADKLHKGMIQQGHARLERPGHTHAVHLGED